MREEKESSRESGGRGERESNTETGREVVTGGLGGSSVDSAGVGGMGNEDRDNVGGASRNEPAHGQEGRVSEVGNGNIGGRPSTPTASVRPTSWTPLNRGVTTPSGSREGNAEDKSERTRSDKGGGNVRGAGGENMESADTSGPSRSREGGGSGPGDRNTESRSNAPTTPIRPTRGRGKRTPGSGVTTRSGGRRGKRTPGSGVNTHSGGGQGRLEASESPVS